MIAVTILGNNSAVPAYGRHPTAQVVQTREQFFLVDCGEGTQMRMDQHKIRRSKINHIFISHLHGDHYFGLIGLLNSYGLNKRENALHIYAPEGLEHVIKIQLALAEAHLPYPLHFYNLNEEGIILEDEKILVSTFKVNHRIPCFGFLFKEKKFPRKLNIAEVKKLNVPKEFYENLHYGEDYVLPDKTVISNEQLTFPVLPPRSYAYCADTAYFENICNSIHGVDLIYHESTYLNELSAKASARFHSTAKDAAMIAKKSNAGRLLLGHFSSMYEDLSEFEKEAREIFENTEASVEGTCYVA